MSNPQPYQKIEPIFAGPSGALWVIRGLNLNLVNAAGLVLTHDGTTAYVVGSAQIVMADAVGSLVVETCVSNAWEVGQKQPPATAIKKHPDDDASIYGSNMRTPGMALEHNWFGVRVTTAIGSDITADVYLSMKP